jgi:hypothetical protein
VFGIVVGMKASYFSAMTPKLLFTAIILFVASFAIAQDSTGTRINKHSPIGLCFELPGVFFWNYQILNTSDVLIAQVRNVDHLIGVGMYVGNRDKFFIGTGLNGHSYNQQVQYTYFHPNFGEMTSSAETWVKNISINTSAYFPLYRKNRSTLFGFSGIQSTAVRMKIWQRDSQSPNGIVPVEYTVSQPWNLDAGLMFDFFRHDIIATDASISIKIGYSFRLSKAKWSTAGAPKPKLEETNASGFHLGLLINFF